VLSNLSFILIIYILVANFCANILIKRGSQSSLNIFINRYTLFGYVLFITVALISFKLIALIELRHFSLVMAINYLMSYIAGVVIFKEETNIIGILGIGLVCLGLVVFTA